MNGRNAGLVDFCSPASGFDMGRNGEIYYYVCPVDVESQFLARYRIGRRVYQLEKANQEIAIELESILKRLETAQISSQQKGRLGQQVKNLRSARSQNHKSLQEIRKNL